MANTFPVGRLGGFGPTITRLIMIYYNEWWEDIKKMSWPEKICYFILWTWLTSMIVGSVCLVLLFIGLNIIL
jgi:hypothetical protein